MVGIAIDNPNGSHRIDSLTRYTRFVVGINAATTTDYSLIVEFSFDKRGLDKAEWRRYLDLISTHREAATANDISIKYLGYANLAFDAEILLPQGTRQKYIFTQITKTGEISRFFSFDTGWMRAPYSGLILISFNRQIEKRLI